MTAAILTAFGLTVYLVAYSRGRSDGFWKGWRAAGDGFQSFMLNKKREDARLHLIEASEIIDRVNSPREAA